MVKTYSHEQILQAVARGWCHHETSHKEMDATLAKAILQEILADLEEPPPASDPQAAGDVVTHEQAMKSARRFIDFFFGNEGEKPSARIPADPDDDDVVLSTYIRQQSNSAEVKP